MGVEKKLQTEENIVILPRRRQRKVIHFQGMECDWTVRHVGRNGETENWERN